MADLEELTEAEVLQKELDQTRIDYEAQLDDLRKEVETANTQRDQAKQALVRSLRKSPGKKITPKVDTKKVRELEGKLEQAEKRLTTARKRAEKVSGLEGNLERKKTEIASLETEVERVTEELEKRDKTINGKNSQLAINVTSIERYVRQLDDLQSSNRRLMEEISATRGKVLRTTPEPNLLEYTLRENSEIYQRNGKNLIDQIFEEIAEVMKTRKFYKEPEELEKAKAVLENKRKYIEEYGEATLELLPQAAKVTTIAEWREAERVLSEYEAEEEIKFLIAAYNNGKMTKVVFPLRPNGLTEVGQKIKRNVGDICKNVPRASIAKGEKYITVKVASTEYNVLEKAMQSYLKDTAEQAKLKLSIFQTDIIL